MDHQGRHDDLPSGCWSLCSLDSLEGGRRMDRSWGTLISLMGVGATSFGAGFILRSMRGGGDMGGDAAGTITWREGAGAEMGRGLGTPTGGAEGLVAEGVGGPACVGPEVLTPDMADAQEERKTQTLRNGKDMGPISGSGHLPQTPPRAFSSGRLHMYPESLINVLFILFRPLYGKPLVATGRG
ncbi:hypothetical protein E2C01_050130 [Portunus trituberculatus]|uniref:Uncharacterized protein n=1 Tax=Portunus trituberculatus TaxID=210409 RepID=A0A5B7GF23_PORTR|nr:hypothetical protein [Portunus trituberculatus]